MHFYYLQCLYMLVFVCLHSFRGVIRCERLVQISRHSFHLQHDQSAFQSVRFCARKHQTNTMWSNWIELIHLHMFFIYANVKHYYVCHSSGKRKKALTQQQKMYTDKSCRYMKQTKNSFFLGGNCVTMLCLNERIR